MNRNSKDKGLNNSAVKKCRGKPCAAKQPTPPIQDEKKAPSRSGGCSANRALKTQNKFPLNKGSNEFDRAKPKTCSASLRAQSSLLPQKISNFSTGKGVGINGSLNKPKTSLKNTQPKISSKNSLVSKDKKESSSSVKNPEKLKVDPPSSQIQEKTSPINQPKICNATKQEEEQKYSNKNPFLNYFSSVMKEVQNFNVVQTPSNKQIEDFQIEKVSIVDSKYLCPCSRSSSDTQLPNLKYDVPEIQSPPQKKCNANEHDKKQKYFSRKFFIKYLLNMAEEIQKINFIPLLQNKRMRDKNKNNQQLVPENNLEQEYISNTDVHSSEQSYFVAHCVCDQFENDPDSQELTSSTSPPSDSTPKTPDVQHSSTTNEEFSMQQDEIPIKTNVAVGQESASNIHEQPAINVILQNKKTCKSKTCNTVPEKITKSTECPIICPTPTLQVTKEANISTADSDLGQQPEQIASNPSDSKPDMDIDSPDQPVTVTVQESSHSSRKSVQSEKKSSESKTFNVAPDTSSRATSPLPARDEHISTDDNKLNLEEEKVPSKSSSSVEQHSTPHIDNSSPAQPIQSAKKNICRSKCNAAAVTKSKVPSPSSAKEEYISTTEPQEEHISAKELHLEKEKMSTKSSPSVEQKSTGTQEEHISAEELLLEEEKVSTKSSPSVEQKSTEPQEEHISKDELHLKEEKVSIKSSPSVEQKTTEPQEENISAKELQLEEEKVSTKSSPSVEQKSTEPQEEHISAKELQLEEEKVSTKSSPSVEQTSTPQTDISSPAQPVQSARKKICRSKCNAAAVIKSKVPSPSPAKEEYISTGDNELHLEEEKVSTKSSPSVGEKSIQSQKEHISKEELHLEEEKVSTKSMPSVEEKSTEPQEEHISAKELQLEEEKVSTKSSPSIEQKTTEPQEEHISAKELQLEEEKVSTKSSPSVEQKTTEPQEEHISAKELQVEEEKMSTKSSPSVEQKTTEPQEEHISAKELQLEEEKVSTKSSPSVEQKSTEPQEEHISKDELHLEEEKVSTKSSPSAEQKSTEPQEEHISAKELQLEEEKVSTKSSPSVEKDSTPQTDISSPAQPVQPAKKKICRSKCNAAAVTKSKVPSPSPVKEEYISTGDKELHMEEEKLSTKSSPSVEQKSTQSQEENIAKDELHLEEEKVSTKSSPSVEQKSTEPQEEHISVKELRLEEDKASTKSRPSVEQKTTEPQEEHISAKELQLEEEKVSTKSSPSVEQKTTEPQEEHISAKELQLEEEKVSTKSSPSVEQKTTEPQEEHISAKELQLEEEKVSTKSSPSVEQKTTEPQEEHISAKELQLEEEKVSTKSSPSVEQKTTEPQEEHISAKELQLEEEKVSTKSSPSVEQKSTEPQEEHISAKELQLEEEKVPTKSSPSVEQKITQPQEEHISTAQEEKISSASVEQRSTTNIELAAPVTEKMEEDKKKICRSKLCNAGPKPLAPNNYSDQFKKEQVQPLSTKTTCRSRKCNTGNINKQNNQPAGSTHLSVLQEIERIENLEIKLKDVLETETAVKPESGQEPSTPAIDGNAFSQPDSSKVTGKSKLRNTFLQQTSTENICWCPVPEKLIKNIQPDEKSKTLKSKTCSALPQTTAKPEFPSTISAPTFKCLCPKDSPLPQDKPKYIQPDESPKTFKSKTCSALQQITSQSAVPPAASTPNIKYLCPKVCPKPDIEVVHPEAELPTEISVKKEIEKIEEMEIKVKEVLEAEPGVMVEEIKIPEQEVEEKGIAEAEEEKEIAEAVEDLEKAPEAKPEGELEVIEPEEERKEEEEKLISELGEEPAKKSEVELKPSEEITVIEPVIQPEKPEIETVEKEIVEEKESLIKPEIEVEAEIKPDEQEPPIVELGEEPKIIPEVEEAPPVEIAETKEEEKLIVPSEEQPIVTPEIEIKLSEEVSITEKPIKSEEKLIEEPTAILEEKEEPQVQPPVELEEKAITETIPQVEEPKAKSEEKLPVELEEKPTVPEIKEEPKVKPSVEVAEKLIVEPKSEEKLVAKLEEPPTLKPVEELQPQVEVSITEPTPQVEKPVVKSEEKLTVEEPVVKSEIDLKPSVAAKEPILQPEKPAVKSEDKISEEPTTKPKPEVKPSVELKPEIEKDEIEQKLQPELKLKEKESEKRVEPIIKPKKEPKDKQKPDVPTETLTPTKEEIKTAKKPEKKESIVEPEQQVTEEIVTIPELQTTPAESQTADTPKLEKQTETVKEKPTDELQKEPEKVAEKPSKAKEELQPEIVEETPKPISTEPKEVPEEITQAKVDPEIGVTSEKPKTRKPPSDLEIKGKEKIKEREPPKKEAVKPTGKKDTRPDKLGDQDLPVEKPAEVGKKEPEAEEEPKLAEGADLGEQKRSEESGVESLPSELKEKGEAYVEIKKSPVRTSEVGTNVVIKDSKLKRASQMKEIGVGEPAIPKKGRRESKDQLKGRKSTSSEKAGMKPKDEIPVSYIKKPPEPPSPKALRKEEETKPVKKTTKCACTQLSLPRTTRRTSKPETCYCDKSLVTELTTECICYKLRKLKKYSCAQTETIKKSCKSSSCSTVGSVFQRKIQPSDEPLQVCDSPPCQKKYDSEPESVILSDSLLSSGICSNRGLQEPKRKCYTKRESGSGFKEMFNELMNATADISIEGEKEVPDFAEVVLQLMDELGYQKKSIQMCKCEQTVSRGKSSKENGTKCKCAKSGPSKTVEKERVRDISKRRCVDTCSKKKCTCLNALTDSKLLTAPQKRKKEAKVEELPACLYISCPVK